jgi:hypothetical protein
MLLRVHGSRVIEAKGGATGASLLPKSTAPGTRDLIRLAARFTHGRVPVLPRLGAAPDSHDSSLFIATIRPGARVLRTEISISRR